MRTVIRTFSDTSSTGLGIQETLLEEALKYYGHHSLFLHWPWTPWGLGLRVFILASPVPAQSTDGTHRTTGNAPGMNAWYKTQHMRDTDKIVLIPYSFQIHRALPGYHPLCSQTGLRASPYPGGLKGQCRAQMWTVHLQDRLKQEPRRGVCEPLRKCRERRVSWICGWHFSWIWETRLMGSCFSQVCWEKPQTGPHTCGNFRTT